MSRFGQALLWVGGALLALLMGYTLAFDAWPGGPPHRGAGRGAAVVAVVYPDRALWQEFRHGVLACVGKSLGALVEESDGSILVATRRHRRPVRFDRHDVRGLRETRDAILSMTGRTPPPVAVVGSSNTVLTEAIAEALRGSGGSGPLLLIPWASSVLADRPEPGDGPVALLDIDPGRTFRFCPNNQRQADMLVDCVLAHDRGALPRRAVVVEDRHDPYSVDLGAAFHRAVERAAPSAEIVERADSVGRPATPDPYALPGPAEEALAESIWREAQGRPEGAITWVLLPLQEEPALRVLNALRRHAQGAPGKGDGPLRVICGDGIGFTSLTRLAGRCPFPVWCSSSASVPAAAKAVGQGVSPDTQIPAEIASALLLCLDEPAGRALTADRLRERLASLRLGPEDLGAMGRSLAFSRSGERVGEDIGHVLLVRPDHRTVDALARSPRGGWTDPQPLASTPVAAQP